MARAHGAGTHALALDCAKLVPRTVDAAPERSSQAVHTALVRRFAGAGRLAEIGTRSGDGMRCFAQVVREAVAIELDQRYCRSLEQGAAQLRRQGRGNYSTCCCDYRSSDAGAAALDADYITWWQQPPVLQNEVILEHLRKLFNAGSIRKSARAVFMFDPLHEPDVQSWERLHPLFEWHESVGFNESKRCCQLYVKRRHPTRSCDGTIYCRRAVGEMRIAAIALSRLP
eukprot:5356811-Prymnesium_polylepis.1